MLKIIRPSACLAAALLTLAVAAPSEAQEDGRVLATVGEESVTAKDIDAARIDAGRDIEILPEKERQQVLLRLAITQALGAQAARAEGLGDTPEFEERMEYVRQRELYNAYLRRHLFDPLDELSREIYGQQQGSFEPQREIRARHILLKSEEEARKVIAELDKGGDFAELAREHSTGPSGPQGGDLGFFGRGRMVPAFEKQAFDLAPGAYSKDPVQTQFGWHVIKVEEERRTEPPSFEQVKWAVRDRVLNARYEELIAELEKTYPVEVKVDAEEGAAAPEASDKQ